MGGCSSCLFENLFQVLLVFLYYLPHYLLCVICLLKLNRCLFFSYHLLLTLDILLFNRVVFCKVLLAIDFFSQNVPRRRVANSVFLSRLDMTLFLPIEPVLNLIGVVPNLHFFLIHLHIFHKMLTNELLLLPKLEL